MKEYFRNYFIRWLSTKWQFAVTAFWVSVVLVWYGKISGAEWVAIITLIGNGYFFTNVYQKRIKNDTKI